MGRAGFCVFLIRKRKWKLFGSELQEQSLICRGGVTWYQDVVIFPCRVNEKNEEVRNEWMDGWMDGWTQTDKQLFNMNV